MKRIILPILCLTALTACQQRGQSHVFVIVSNNTQHDAMNVVDGVPLQALLDSLGAPADATIRLTDEQGQPVCTQIFDNGTEELLLFESCTLAGGESRYTATIASSQDAAVADSSAVYVGLFPKRKDDLTWENESSIWRAYGPTLQASGERAFGYDIWCKSTKRSVTEERYYKFFRGYELADSLHALGLDAAADSTVHAMTFHIDHGDGMDCYAVGPTLGGGTAALLSPEGGIIYPWAWRSHQILANGPLLAAFKLDYDTLLVGNDTVFEHRTIVTQKGTRFNIINVTYDGLSSPHDIAVGIVYHDWPDSVRLDDKGRYIAYSDPSDQPGNDPGRVLVGAYIPTLQRTALEQGHLLGIAHYTPGDTFTYYMGSGWSKGDCPSLEQMCSELQQLSEAPRSTRIMVTR